MLHTVPHHVGHNNRGEFDRLCDADDGGDRLDDVRCDQHGGYVQHVRGGLQHHFDCASGNYDCAAAVGLSISPVAHDQEAK